MKKINEEQVENHLIKRRFQGYYNIISYYSHLICMNLQNQWRENISLIRSD